MHEWALAEAVISTASRIAEKEGLKEVTEVIVKIGELQQIEVEILAFALSQLKTTSSLENTAFVIETVSSEFKCRACGHQWSFSKEELGEEVQEDIHFVPEVAHAYVRCPRCGSPDFEVLQGRGVWIERIKGVK